MQANQLPCFTRVKCRTAVCVLLGDAASNSLKMNCKRRVKDCISYATRDGGEKAKKMQKFEKQTPHPPTLAQEFQQSCRLA